MTKLRFTLVLLVLLFLGLSLAAPAQDLTETAYDESEGQPCESTPLIRDVVPSATASATQRRESPTCRQLASPYRVTSAGIAVTDGHHCAEALVALALLCTLLC